jgi:hypothetical protein
MRFKSLLLVFVLGLVLYTYTLAPTVLWFDDAHLQLRAVTGELGGSAGHHPLWVWVAHQFTKVPIGDMAARVNFVSAIFAALTLTTLYAVLIEVGLDLKVCLATTVAFSVSHTFWSYAVRAEVYTLTLFLMAVQVWGVLRWYHTGQGLYLALAGLTVGLGVGTHLMVLLYSPALLWLVLLNSDRNPFSDYLLFGGAFVVGSAPLLILLRKDAMTMGLSFLETLYWAIFTFEGYSFSSSFFDFSLHLFPSDLFNWISFAGLQFLGLAGLLGIVGIVKGRKLLDYRLVTYSGLLYFGVMFFSISYRIGERYAFYLPSYLPFTIFIGAGLQLLWKKVENYGMKTQTVLYVAVLVTLGAVPPLSYRLLPSLVSRGITFRDTRHVPGPNGAYYFLWPPKKNYWDARDYAEGVLDSLPPDAVLLADPVLSSPVTYLQRVEDERGDVTVRYCCWDIEEAVEIAGDRPLAIADTHPSIYPLDWLLERYKIEPRGPVYLLRNGTY